ncbi:hypothetical protein BKA62DRAFT_765837 [Auriculariales sp. MPI-PUGE-AT-0066]|nr:hypothetical protein BKA62DRAFT_765837 [Auriculariales sp. MPI-PUGE-AT-0066]
MDDLESLFGSRTPSPVSSGMLPSHFPGLALPSGSAMGASAQAGPKHTNVGAIALHGCPPRAKPLSQTAPETNMWNIESPKHGIKRRRAPNSPPREEIATRHDQPLPKRAARTLLPMDLPLRAEDAPPHLLRNHVALLGVAGQVARLRMPPQTVAGTSAQHPIVVDDRRSTEACGPLLLAEPSVQQLLGDTAFVSVLHQLLPPSSTRRPSQPPSSSKHNGHTSDNRSVVSSSSTSSTRSRLRDRMGHRRRIATLSDSAGSSLARSTETVAKAARLLASGPGQDVSTVSPSSPAGFIVPNYHTTPLIDPYNILLDDLAFAPPTPTLSYSDSTTASPVSTPSELFDDFSQLLQSMNAGSGSAEPLAPPLFFGPSESLPVNVADDSSFWAFLQSMPPPVTATAAPQPAPETKHHSLPEVPFDFTQFLELGIPESSEQPQDTGYC